MLKRFTTILLAAVVILSAIPEVAATEHAHDWQCQQADTRFHKMVCSGCGEEMSSSHTFDDTECCPICGYEVHEHIWQEVVEIYATTHHLRCAKCDTTTSQEHSFGSNGKCTTCGCAPPHWHEWVCNGEQYLDRYHVLECACGETKTEEHAITWDGVTRTHRVHGIVCKICGKTDTTMLHGFNKYYFNGERCRLCGYETVPHTWEYANDFDEDSHMMYCPDYDTFASERHKPDESGDCVVCGYHVYDIVEPETKPTEPDSPEDKPAESQPGEPESTEAEHTNIDANETKTDETGDPETEPTESNPDETDRTEENPTELEIVPEDTGEEKLQRGNILGIWAMTIIAVAFIGIGIVVFFLIKRR